MWRFRMRLPLCRPATGSMQERIVTWGLQQEPLLAILPAGGDKSLCYQLPAIVRNEQTGSLTVVISPLQALMKDQVDYLVSRTRAASLAAALNGLQTMPERRDVLERIRHRRFALLYVSPEQLRRTSFGSAIRQREIAAWIFDEAHSISNGGTTSAPTTSTRLDPSGSSQREKASRLPRWPALPALRE